MKVTPSRVVVLEEEKLKEGREPIEVIPMESATAISKVPFPGFTGRLA